MTTDERFGLTPQRQLDREEAMAERRRRFGQVMTSGGFTAAEKFVAEAQMYPKEMGNFRHKLWEVICNADESNKDRLALGFPDEVAAVRAWQNGNLARRFREAGLQV